MAGTARKGNTVWPDPVLHAGDDFAFEPDQRDNKQQTNKAEEECAHDGKDPGNELRGNTPAQEEGLQPGRDRRKDITHANAPLNPFQRAFAPKIDQTGRQ